jgi:hypothetical protein
MSRRVSIKRTTLIDAIESQEELLKQFDKVLSSIQKKNSDLHTLNRELNIQETFETSDEKVKKAKETYWKIPGIRLGKLILTISDDYTYLAVCDINIIVYHVPSKCLKVKIEPKIKPDRLSFSKDSHTLYYSNGTELYQIRLFEDLDVKIVCDVPSTCISLFNEGPNLFYSCDSGIYHYNDDKKTLNQLDDGSILTLSCMQDNSRKKTLKESIKRQQASLELCDSYKLFTGKRGRIREYPSEQKSPIFKSTKFLNFFYSNSTHLLDYDGLNITIHNIINYSLVNSYQVSNVTKAVLSYDSSYLIYLVNEEIVIKNIQSGSIKSTAISSLQALSPYNLEPSLVLISKSSELILFNIEENSQEVTFKVPVELTGQVSIHHNDKYLFASSAKGISIISIQDYMYLATIPIENLSCFCLSIKEKRIFYCVGTTLYSIINPVSECDDNPVISSRLILLEFEDITYEKWRIISSMTRIDTNKDLEQDNLIDFTIMPYCITPVLVYSNFNRISLIKKAMRQGFKYMRYTNKLLSPLTVAICRNNKEVIKCLMKDIILSSDNDPIIFLRVEDDINELNYKGATTRLEYFYKMVFLAPKDKLTQVSTLKNQGFVGFESNSNTISESNFLNTKSNADGQLLTYRVSAFRIKIQEFTQESIEFLNSIICCPSTDIMKTPIIQAILLYKWRKLKWLVLWQFISFMIYLSLISYYAVTFRISGAEFDLDKIDKTILTIACIFNTFFLIAELPLFYIDPLNYIKDTWNMLDCFRIFTFYALFILSFLKVNFVIFYLLSITILISWIRVVAFFRIFKPTRYLVLMITEVTRYIMPFFLVLLYSITSFSLIGFLSNSEGQYYFIQELNTQFMVNFGQFDTSNYNYIEWMQFIGSSFSNTLIMMTMIISLMGSIYERVEETSLIADYKEMASYILEIESIFLILRRKSSKKYFQFCYANASLQLGQKEDFIDEKIEIMEKKINRIKQKFNLYEKNIYDHKTQCEQELQSLLQEVVQQYQKIAASNSELNNQLHLRIK